MAKIGPQGIATDATLPEEERQFWSSEARVLPPQPVDEPVEQSEPEDDTPDNVKELPKRTRKN